MSALKRLYIKKKKNFKDINFYINVLKLMFKRFIVNLIMRNYKILYENSRNYN